MATSGTGKTQGNGDSPGGRRPAGARGGAAGAGGSGSRARRDRTRTGAGTRPRAAAERMAADDYTVPATDEVLTATSTRRALSPDMPRVAWLRTQLQNLEAHRRYRLAKAFQLAVIAVVFMVFVLQNAEVVPVEILFFSLNLRLIWVIVGCGLLGGLAGYLVARPDKGLRTLLPGKRRPDDDGARSTAR